MTVRITVSRPEDPKEDLLAVGRLGWTHIAIRTEDPQTPGCKRSVLFSSDHLGPLIVALEQMRKEILEEKQMLAGQEER